MADCACAAIASCGDPESAYDSFTLVKGSIGTQEGIEWMAKADEHSAANIPERLENSLMKNTTREQYTNSSRPDNI